MEIENVEVVCLQLLERRTDRQMQRLLVVAGVVDSLVLAQLVALVALQSISLELVHGLSPTTYSRELCGDDHHITVPSLL